MVFADDKQVLGVSETINLVLEKNTELHIAKLELDNAKIEKQKREANNLINQSYSSEIEAKLNLMRAQNQYYETQTGLIKEVLSKYAKVFLAKKDLEIKRKEKALERIKLDKIKAQLEQGYRII
jgi:hypothetical protein